MDGDACTWQPKSFACSDREFLIRLPPGVGEPPSLLGSRPGTALGLWTNVLVSGWQDQ